MKKIIILWIISFLTISVQVQAQEKGLNGLFLGAGSGALIGQAIGRDTEATLLGSAVGSMLGYIIGNEMDKEGYSPQTTQTTYRPRTYYTPPPQRHHPQPKIRYSSAIPVEPEPQIECRETEMLATINGRPEKIVGTACWEDGRWVMESEKIMVSNIIIDENKRPYGKNRKNVHFRNRGNSSYRQDTDNLLHRSAWHRF